MNYNLLKIIGWSLIAGSVLLFIPYTILVIQFDYPDILRKETGEILTQFNSGGSRLILTWLAFSLVGLPLLAACVLIGQIYNGTHFLLKLATTFGVIGFTVQIIGLLRWAFVVPILASDFVNGSEITRIAIETNFKVIHQFGGVLLGEHLGQLFTVAWTVIISSVFLQLKTFPKWLPVFGIISSLIYLSAQAELLHTVIPSMPYFELSGFIGSTLWLIYLIILGIKFLNLQKESFLLPIKVFPSTYTAN